MAIPSPRQSRCVWSFCCNYGSKGHGHKDWKAHAQAGRLTKRNISPIISNVKAFEESPSKDMKIKIEIQINEYFPGFKIVSEPFPKGPDKFPKAKQESGSEVPSPPDVPNPAPNPDSGTDRIKEMLENLEEEMKDALPPDREQTAIPKYNTTGDYIKPDEFDEICHLSKMGINVLLTGPAGLGKSRLGKEMATALDVKNCFTISFGGAMRFGQIFGTTQIKTDDSGNQVSEWVPAPMLRAMQEEGVVVLDEVFSAESDITNGLNSILERSDRTWMSPIGLIKVHDKCHIVATANTNGRALSNQYSGANVADGALVNRFKEIPMTYNEKVENQLLSEISDIETVTYIKTNLDKLRQNIRTNNIFYDASTRALIDLIDMYKGGFSSERAFEIAFLIPLSKAERTKCGF